MSQPNPIADGRSILPLGRLAHGLYHLLDIARAEFGHGLGRANGHVLEQWRVADVGRVRIAVQV